MKNVVVCCDGTGNEVSENISNVLKLYRVLRKTGKTAPRQVVFYDPGGRLLNYGTIHVLGTGEGIESLRRIAAPLALRNAITAK